MVLTNLVIYFQHSQHKNGIFMPPGVHPIGFQAIKLNRIIILSLQTKQINPFDTPQIQDT